MGSQQNSDNLSSKASEKKEHILRCAKKIFAAKGYYETQIIDIVKELKIGKGTPYQYFKNKEELFLALVNSIYQSWSDYNRHNITIFDSTKPVDYFRSRYANILYFFQSDPDSAHILLRMGPGINRNIDPFVSRIEQRFIDELRLELEKGIKKGTVQQDSDIELLTNIVFGSITRIAYHYIIERKDDISKKDFSHLIDKTTNTLKKIIFKPEFW